MAPSRDVVAGVFEDTGRAREAIAALRDAGFMGSDISVLMPDREDTRTLAADTGTEAGEGAATGLVAGGILGGIGGWLVGIGALAIPGVGPFIAAGALGAALSGVVYGVGIGVVAGALVGMGIPEEDAHWYEQEVRGGRALVTVHAGGRDDLAEDILHQYGAYDVEHRNAAAYTPRRVAATQPPGATQPAATPRSMAATVTAATATGGATYMAGAGGTAPVTVGAGAAHGDGAMWADVSPRFRSEWQARYGRAGGAGWAEYEPRYRFGWEMGSRPEYRGRTWAEMEPTLRTDWEGRYGTGAWNDARDAVRAAWMSAGGRPVSG